MFNYFSMYIFRALYPKQADFLYSKNRSYLELYRKIHKLKYCNTNYSEFKAAKQTNNNNNITINENINFQMNKTYEIISMTNKKILHTLPKYSMKI